MSSYRDISLRDLDDAMFCLKSGRYRLAVLSFQQFAEKSAKALLEKKSPEHKLLRSHFVEKILQAYDPEHKTSEIGDKARYLTSFYFDCRYPGDNYTEIEEAQAQRAYKFALELNEYFIAELAKLKEIVDSEQLNL